MLLAIKEKLNRQSKVEVTLFTAKAVLVLENSQQLLS